MIKKLLYVAIFFSTLGAHEIVSFSVAGAQMSVFRFLILVSLLACVCNGMKGQMLILTKRKNSYSVIFYFIWFLWTIVSLLWGKDIGDWFRNMFFLFLGLTEIILFTNYFKSDEDILNACKAFLAGITIQSIIGWYEIITKNYYFIEMNEKNLRYYVNSNNYVPVAMTGNPNNFACMMFVGIFLAYTCWTCAKKSKGKLLNVILGINCIILLFATQSRAGILAFALASLMLVLLKAKKRTSIILFSFGFLIMSIFAIFILQHISNNGLQEGSDSIRFNLILNGLYFVYETYGFGVGAGQVENWMAEKALWDTASVTNVHNWWMEILSNYGILLFIGYLIFYIKLLADNLRNVKNVSYSGYNKISILVCVIMTGFIIASIGPSSVMSIEWIWIIWAIFISYQGII